MKTVVLSERSRDPLLHLNDGYGRSVVSIETIPNDYAGEPRVARDGYANTRLIEETDEAPFCPLCGSPNADCYDGCEAVPARGA